MNIHKEGRQFLSKLFAITIAADFGAVTYLKDHTLVLIAVLLFFNGFFLFFLQFFRNPKRNTPLDEQSIIAPADGKIVVIEETMESEYLNEKRIQISIFMSPFNVHVNRNAVSGVITYFKYHTGKFLVAWHPKSSTDNERTTVVYKTSSGLEILIRQIAGAVARRICWYIEEGDEVKQGEEFGFIKFGSRVDLFLPLDSEILVSLNQTTTGGETVLAKLKS
jgi:phosphatidylserine decarboxylase